MKKFRAFARVAFGLMVTIAVTKTFPPTEHHWVLWVAWVISLVWVAAEETRDAG